MNRPVADIVADIRKRGDRGRLADEAADALERLEVENVKLRAAVMTLRADSYGGEQ